MSDDLVSDVEIILGDDSDIAIALDDTAIEVNLDTGIPGPVGPPGEIGPPGESSGLVDSFAEDGANYPLYGNFVQPQALYEPTSNRTWFVYLSFRDRRRAYSLRFYDHGTSKWSDNYLVAYSEEEHDDHGQPVIGIDSDGYLYVVAGVHNGEQKVYASAAPRDPSLFALQHTFSGSYTYPHLINVHGAFYLFFRDGDAGSGKLVLFKSTAVGSGAITWASVVPVVDLTPVPNGIYLTTCEVVGSDIHMLFVKSASQTHFDPSYLVYATASGNVSNIGGGTTTAAGSLPLLEADIDADYRLVATDGVVLPGAAFCFDNNHVAHFIYADLAGADTQILHSAYVGGALTTPHVLATLSAGSFFELDVSLVPGADGTVAAYWAVQDVDDLGDLVTARRSAAGSWGSASVFRKADKDNIGTQYAIKSPHANARLIFSEVQLDYYRTEGTARLWVVGDGGYIESSNVDDVQRGVRDRSWRAVIEPLVGGDVVFYARGEGDDDAVGAHIGMADGFGFVANADLAKLLDFEHMANADTWIRIANGVGADDGKGGPTLSVEGGDGSLNFAAGTGASAYFNFTGAGAGFITPDGPNNVFLQNLGAESGEALGYLTAYGPSFAYSYWSFWLLDDTPGSEVGGAYLNNLVAGVDKQVLGIEAGLFLGATAVDKGLGTIYAENGVYTDAFIEVTEMSAPAAPGANKARLFVQDSGGKSQLAVRFPTGAVQVVATEP